MNINANDNDNISGTLILPLWQGTVELSEGMAAGIHRILKNQIDMVLSNEDFKAKAGSKMNLLGTEGGKAILVGLGKEKDATIHTFRDAGAGVTAGRKKVHGTELTVRLHGHSAENSLAFAEGIILRDYKYDRYKSKDDDSEDESELAVHIQVDTFALDEVSSGILASTHVATGVHLARNLGNAPPNDLYPMAYAKQATEWAENFDNATVKVINYEEAITLGMGGLVGVGMGSDRKPCMIIFELNGDKPGPSPCFVGKGITFDTGGISIKPSASMDEMKYDMHGSATVFGLMQALAESGWDQRVVAVACMAENMPSSNAQRPGDVITTHSGKTVEVLNTDAEGRLVLSDGLWYAGKNLNVEYIIDLATLTGACVVALGHEASGLWSNNDDLRERIRAAGEACGELAWPMPLLPAFEKDMKDSKIADVRNIGGTRWGGSNTAAAFLKQFVPNQSEDEDAEQIPWAHLDIAGTAWGAKTNKMVAHGATGIHVRTLHRLVTNK